MLAEALRCEYLQNPLGLDKPNPRLSWRLNDQRRGARQTAYSIRVASSREALLAGKGDLWDSGKVESSQNTHVVYAGRPLGSSERAWWSVRVWDEHMQPSDWAEPAWWEMGLLQPSDWKAHWIGAPLVGGRRASVPCPYLRKEFSLAKPLLSARLYITALGLYEASINGHPVGDAVLAPGWTEYHKRVEYQTYDVTEHLQVGANVLGAILGDGWFCGHIEWRGRQFYGDGPRLLAQLHVRYEDGTEELVVSDASWLFTTGPLLESDLLMGETYNARLEMPGWDCPGYSLEGWRPVQVFDPWPAPLCARNAPPVRRKELLSPVEEPRQVPGWPLPRWIFDLGQNMVGRVRLKVHGPAGTTITLRHGEMLNPDGTLYTENLRTAKQTDTYILRGEGEEVYEPHFTFHGFRYVEVTGLTEKPPRDLLTGVVLHSDMPATGTFSCSNPLINQLHHNIVWGHKGNSVDIPTDCPQRDERLGWTGDAQVFVRTGAFIHDIAAFFSRWLRTLEDSQSEEGAYPPISPNTNAAGNDGGPAWADAGVICPWTLFLCYADTQILQDRYASMGRFMEWLEKTAIEDIRCHPDYHGFHGFGDWLATHPETPADLIGTAFYAYSARLMHQIAAVLGKEDDAKRYRSLHERVRDAFQRRFLTPDGLLVSNTQTSCVLALAFDLVPNSVRSKIAKVLVRDIRARGNHLSTGFVGTPYLLHVLTREGYLDVAYDLLMQRTWPSWLYPVTQGATTIWERWDSWTEERGFQDPSMNSFNHYAYGAVGSWLYQVVAGIDTDESTPGYRHLHLAPKPGGGLEWAAATLETLHGRVRSAWRLEENRFFWDVELPPNTSATAILPVKAGATISESGRPLSESPGIKQLDPPSEEVALLLESGSYRFVALLE